MTYNDLMLLFFERSNALQAFWTIYVTVIGALVAFCATRTRVGLFTMVTITVGFVAFASVNLSGMRDIESQRLAAKEALKEFPLPEEKAERSKIEFAKSHLHDTLSPPSVNSVTAFHILADVLTVSALWIMSYRKPERATVALSTTKVV